MSSAAQLATDSGRDIANKNAAGWRQQRLGSVYAACRRRRDRNGRIAGDCRLRCVVAVHAIFIQNLVPQPQQHFNANQTQPLQSLGSVAGRHLVLISPTSNDRT